MKAFPGAQLDLGPETLRLMNSDPHFRGQLDRLRMDVRVRLGHWMDKHRPAPLPEVLKAQKWFDAQISRLLKRRCETLDKLGDAFKKAEQRYNARTGSYEIMEACRLRWSDFYDTGTLKPLSSFRKKRPKEKVQPLTQWEQTLRDRQSAEVQH